jgi:hypothetical protein
MEAVRRTVQYVLNGASRATHWLWPSAEVNGGYDAEMAPHPPHPMKEWDLPTQLARDVCTLAERTFVRDVAPCAQQLRAQHERVLGLPRGILRRPLPLICSLSEEIVEPQLLDSVGDDAAKLLGKLRQAVDGSDQTPKVIVGAASSGLGKTHLAYAIGVRAVDAPADAVFSLVIRVCVPQLNRNHKPKYSEPWYWLLTQLKQMEASLTSARSSALGSPAPTRQSNGARVQAAEDGESLLQLTILAYVHVAYVALSHLRAAHPGITQLQLRHVLVRLFRNGESDQFVLEALKAAHANSGILHNRAGYMAISTKWLTGYRSTLHAAMNDLMGGGKLLLTFDEAHNLMTKGANLFVKEDTRNAALGLTTPQTFRVRQPRSQHKRQAAPASTSGGKDDSRTLFTELLRVLGDLAVKEKWMQYLTGTALRMTEVQFDEKNTSVTLRVGIDTFAPSVLLTIQSLKDELRKYWFLSQSPLGGNDVLDDEDVHAQLARFVGRPLFFQVAWRCMHRLIFTHKCEPSPKDLCEELRLEADQLVEQRREMMDEQLKAKIEISRDGTTSNRLLPRMIDEFLFHDGNLALGDDPTDLDKAIAYGFLAVSASKRSAHARDEPIVLEALKALCTTRAKAAPILDMLVQSHDAVPCDRKGELTEQALCWYIALAGVAAQGASLTLRDLFKAMGNCALEPLPSGLDLWQVAVCKVDRWRRAGAGARAALRCFIGADGVPLVDTVIHGLPTNMGADVAFLVYQELAGGGRRYALVAVQCKNKAAGSVPQVLLTLHPGTQYMVNGAREELLAIGNPTEVRVCEDWLDWTSLWQEAKSNDALQCLVDGWIRVALVARPVDTAVVTFSRDVVEDTVGDALGWTGSQRRAAAASPIVWLSLAPAPLMAEPTNAFPQSVRKALVSTTDTGSALTLRADMKHVWLPRTVEDAVDKFGVRWGVHKMPRRPADPANGERPAKRAKRA